MQLSSHLAGGRAPAPHYGAPPPLASLSSNPTAARPEADRLERERREREDRERREREARREREERREREDRREREERDRREKELQREARRDASSAFGSKVIEEAKAEAVKEANNAAVEAKGELIK